MGAPLAAERHNAMRRWLAFLIAAGPRNTIRRCLALLLSAAVAAAQDDSDLARQVDELVRELGAPTAEARMLASYRLAAFGERVKPLLERVESDDPEIRRAIRCLTRSGGKVLLELLPRREGVLPIGAALTLEVRIVNHTEQTYRFLPEAARQGEAGPFRVRVGGRTLAPVGFDQVDWGEDGVVTVLPGASRLFRLRLGGASSPLRRPALYDVSVVFDGKVQHGYGAIDDESAETEPLFRETAAIQVHVLGRKAEDLEKALGSDNAREREAAAKELALRDDEAIVPILRRHAGEPLLRLAAVRRLGALGAAEDFDLVFEATRDEDADVRRAAVLGLGKHPSAKSRSRLLLLVSDQELQAEAITALRGHKHPATVERYLKLLRAGGCPEESVKTIRRTLREWTGLTVDQRPSEIRAFEAWWEENAARWAQENASGK
jgi:HEAT repeat protein